MVVRVNTDLKETCNLATERQSIPRWAEREAATLWADARVLNTYGPENSYAAAGKADQSLWRLVRFCHVRPI
jgi:hypothetical protein